MDNHGQMLDNVWCAPQTRRTFLRRAGVLCSFATMANLLQMNTADTLITDSDMSRRAKKLDFVPGRDGFHFSNHFTNHLLFGITTAGRCGGMTYAALDYYLAGLPIPTHTSVDFGHSGVPADGTVLADYLWWRQIASLIENGTHFLSLPWITDEQWFSWSVQSVFPQLCHRIDQGQISVLGLLSKDSAHPQKGHQVVAYGYAVESATNTITIDIWDNNYPDREMVLRPLHPGVGIQEAYSESPSEPVREPWRAFFIESYKWHAPTYLDIALKEGLRLHGPDFSQSSSTPTISVNNRLVVDLTVRNYGDYPAHLSQLLLSVRGPSNEHLDSLLGGGDGNSTSLQPGEERSLHQVCNHFGSYQGRYTIRAFYLSQQGYELPIPPGNAGTSNEVQIDVVQP